jgi:hypothetical protein
MSQMNYLVPIRLNNKGAELLSRGKIKEARVFIVKAMHLTKLITLSLLKLPQRNETSVTVEYHFLSRIPLNVAPESFIFQRPVQIVERKELGESKSLAVDFSTAFIFNLSLSFHIQGLKSSNLFKKALYGYECALDVRKIRKRTSSRLFDLGLLNNIGHIHLEMSNYESAKPFFNNIAHLLKHHNQDDMDAIELEGFTMGALWRIPSCAPSA